MFPFGKFGNCVLEKGKNKINELEPDLILHDN